MWCKWLKVKSWAGGESAGETPSYNADVKFALFVLLLSMKDKVSCLSLCCYHLKIVLFLQNNSDVSNIKTVSF